MTHPLVYVRQEQIQEAFQEFINAGINLKVGVGFSLDGGELFHIYTTLHNGLISGLPVPSAFKFLPDLPTPESINSLAEAISQEVFGIPIISERQSLIAFFAIKEGKLEHLVVIRHPNGSYHKGLIKFIPDRSELYSRTTGLLETSVLENCKVAIVGLGSGGSAIAVELAKAGIGNFVLIDFDRLELGNVSRHICGVGDLGRYKTKAVKDALLAKNPYVKVETAEIDINQNLDLTKLLLKDSNLIIAATDNDRSRFNLNSIALEFSIPTIFGRALARASGGDVLRVRPQQGVCLACVFSQDFLENRTEEVSQFRQAREANPAYVPNDSVAATVQVGLSSDIIPISNMVTKLALVELSRGRESGISSLEDDLVADFYIWANRRDGVYQNWEKMGYGSKVPSILRWYGAKWDRNLSCPACGEVELSEEDNIFG